ncbi:MAG: nucleotidyltransferase family protein, partial [Elusimicrobiota bacterium]
MRPKKAMLLAAGAGTRLRPLTDQTPKPMVPVVNRPVIGHVLDNLLKHGVEEVMINLHMHPEQVRGYCGDGSRWSLKIRYSPEPKLLGTAGAIKKTESFFKDGPFFVMSGDGLSDIDLGAMSQFHRRRGSFATMAVKQVDARFDYGVTLMDAARRIVGFLEKPSWGDVFSNKVNTGIYLFEPEVLALCPKGKVFDFGRDLWPRLLKLKKPIYAYETDSYWCDVGNLAEYRRCQIDCLDRKVNIRIPGVERRLGVWIQEGSLIDPKTKLTAPVRALHLEPIHGARGDHGR